MKIINVSTFKSMFLSANKFRYKIASLDFGTKHIGVALADETKESITPVGDIDRMSDRMSSEATKKLSMQLQKIVNEHNIGGFVVGFPLLENGSLTPLCEEIITIVQTLECKQKVSKLSPETEMVCTFWDERSSTIGARRMARNFSGKQSVRQKYKDSFAACLILKGFINHSL